MKHLIDFFLKAGEVKRLKQRGLVLRGIKDPVTVGAHSFREALMGWVLARVGNTGLDSGRVIKLVLIRDLCAGYAGDPTPYDSVLKKTSKKDFKKMYTRWVRLSKSEKERAYRARWKHEQKSLKKLTKNLPEVLALEMEALWKEFQEGMTREGKFVQQLHFLENFLQSLEYWREDKKFPIESWWQQMKELISDSLLLELLKELDQEFYRKRKMM